MSITDRFYELLNEHDDKDKLISFMLDNYELIKNEFTSNRVYKYMSFRYDYIDFYRDAICEFFVKLFKANDNNISIDIIYSLGYRFSMSDYKKINEGMYLTYIRDEIDKKIIKYPIRHDFLVEYHYDVEFVETDGKSYYRTKEHTKDELEIAKKLHTDIFINDDLEALKAYIKKYEYEDYLDAINTASFYRFFEGLIINKSLKESICTYVDCIFIFDLLILYNDINCLRYYLTNDYDIWMNYRYIIHSSDDVFKLLEEFDRIDYMKVIKTCIKYRANYYLLEYAYKKVLLEIDIDDYENETISKIIKMINKYDNKEAYEIFNALIVY